MLGQKTARRTKKHHRPKKTRNEDSNLRSHYICVWSHNYQWIKRTSIEFIFQFSRPLHLPRFSSLLTTRLYSIRPRDLFQFHWYNRQSRGGDVLHFQSFQISTLISYNFWNQLFGGFVWNSLRSQRVFEKVVLL